MAEASPAHPHIVDRHDWAAAGCAGWDVAARVQWLLGHPVVDGALLLNVQGDGDVPAPQAYPVGAAAVADCPTPRAVGVLLAQRGQ